MLDHIFWSGPLISGLLTWLALSLLQPVAGRLDLLDHPKGRKDHAHPTPITGGIAMAVGVMVAGMMTLTTVGTSFFGFMAAALLLVVVGLLDDKYDLRWWIRVLAQVAAALIMVYVGDVRISQLGPAFGLPDMSLGWLSVPFTVFATVGLINAVNMVDGIDGLAGTLVLTALVLFSFAALYSGNTLIGERSLVLAGAVAAFLYFNLRTPWRPRAALFMGNAGSAFLGFAIAWIAFRLTQSPSHPVNPSLALWLLPIPVMDCLVLLARRVRQRKSPFSADRDHIHHLMLDAGFTPSLICATLAIFSALCGLAAGQAMRFDVPHPVIVAVFVAMCMAWYWVTSRRQRALGFLRFVRARGFFGSPLPWMGSDLPVVATRAPCHTVSAGSPVVRSAEGASAAGESELAETPPRARGPRSRRAA